MTIDYNEYEIIRRESNHYRQKPFIGYISPNGNIIDFSLLIGEPGHGNWRNPITPVFLSYISFLVLGENYDDCRDHRDKFMRDLYYNNKYDGYDNIVRRGLSRLYTYNTDDYASFIEKLNSAIENDEKSKQTRAQLHQELEFTARTVNSEWMELKHDLLQFFKKCYSKEDFFNSFGRIIAVQNMDIICDLYNNRYEDSLRGRNEFYYNYCVVTLMSYFKDIMVQYLGYDSIERAVPDWDTCIINNMYRRSNGYRFSSNPKTILTSCLNPNERFWNWKINGWKVERLPKMLWNEKEGKFVEESSTLSFYQTEKETILGMEIDSILKEVPKQYRKDFIKK